MPVSRLARSGGEADHLSQRIPYRTQVFRRSAWTGDGAGVYRSDRNRRRMVPSLHQWEFSHAVLKKPRAGDFRVQTNLGGTVTALQAPREIQAFAETVLKRLSSTAVFARVDIVDNGLSLLLMELEVIEPELFLDLAPGSSPRLASAIRAYIFQDICLPCLSPRKQPLPPTLHLKDKLINSIPSR